MDDENTISLTVAQADGYARLCASLGVQVLRRLPAAHVNPSGTTGAVGWALRLDDSNRRLWIILPGNFPLASPRVRVQPATSGVWPHVDLDGYLCLWPDALAPVGKSPLDQIDQTLERVGEILDLVYRASRLVVDAEFGREWLSYWPSRAVGVAAANALLLSNPNSASPTTLPANVILTTPGGRVRRSFILIGGDNAQATAWASALDSVGASRPREHRALLVPISTPIIGAPAALQDLYTILEARAPSAVPMLKGLLHETEDSAFVVFALTTLPPSFVALELTRARLHHPFERRPDPKQVRERWRRNPLAWHVKALDIERADPSWLHGRGYDSDAQRLADKHVWLMGCGSLGSLVALGLALAGVGHLTLVDPERLEVANLGRHVLTARSLGKFKVIELAEHIREHLPHARIDPIARRYPDARPSAQDLVLSTAANWPSELPLIADHADHRFSWLQLVWAEPNAIAGHSVMGDSNSDLRALFDSDGLFRRTLTSWDRTFQPLPGCSGVHIPGTYNRIQRIAGLAIEQAIAHLLGHGRGEHLAWLGDGLTLQRLGGTWRQRASAPAGIRERTLELSVPTTP